jgi:GntR family phosphonate transport system transcriptional regulator
VSEGVSVWRQVSDELIREIEAGVIGSETRLPKAQELAARFGVNRHTVLRALAHLQTLGFVRVERSRGARIVVNPIEYRIGMRHWFEQNLLELGRTPSRTVLSVVEMPAIEVVAHALDIAPGRPVARVTLLGEADGAPINYNTHFFPMQRLPAIADAFRAFGTEPTTKMSFSGIFRSMGIPDWRRRSIKIRSRPPRPEEVRHLKMPSSDHVLETEVISVDGADVPLVYATTSFCSSRVELALDLSERESR